MDTTTLDFNTLALLVAILGSTMGSTLTLVTLIVRQSNRHEDSIKALEIRLTGRIDDLDTKFTAKIDDLGGDLTDARERLGRIEGYLMAPGGFKVRSLDPPGPSESSPDDPNHRAAG